MADTKDGKKKAPRTRPERWAAAIAEARDALDKANAALGALIDPLATLQELKDEYEAWKDNLPDNLQQSPTAEKLEEVCNLDFEVDVESLLDEVSALLDEAEGVDLPRGFGKD